METEHDRNQYQHFWEHVLGQQQSQRVVAWIFWFVIMCSYINLFLAKHRYVARQGEQIVTLH